MAPSDVYASAGSTGKLKLKGVKDSKVEKKKKKKSSSSKQRSEDHAEDGTSEFADRSVMLKKLEDEDRALAEEQEDAKTNKHGRDEPGEEQEDQGETLGEVVKTEAERRFEEQRRRRVSLLISAVRQILTRLDHSLKSD
jgi:protein FAM32A